MANKDIVKSIGIEASIMFAILCDAESIVGCEFYQTYDMVRALSCGLITEKKFRDTTKALEKYLLITTEIKSGLPPRRYFKINRDVVLDKLNFKEECKDMAVKDYLGKNAFFLINKKIVKIFGIECALILSILSDAEKIFSDTDENAGFVYQTQPTIEEKSFGFLTRTKQTTAIKKLIEAEIIEQRNMGLPMKRYFKINRRKLIETILND